MNEIKPIETVYNGYRFRSRLEARWAVFFDSLGIEYEYESEGYCNVDGVNYLPDFYLPEFRCLFEVKRGGLFEGGCPNKELSNSEDWEKILAVTESLKLHNDNLLFDYIILASGDPFECCVENKTNCGLLFNGIIGVLDYRDNNGDLTPHIIPLTEKDGCPMWGHLPVCFEYIGTSDSENPIIFFGKRSYEDFEQTDRSYEVVPIGKRCGSLIAIMRGVIPRYRGEPLIDPPSTNGYFALSINKDSRSPIYSACAKSRQARFEHGETPRI